jgi:hypothetical protein
MCPIRQIPIIYSCIIDRNNNGHFHDWIRVITIHQSSTLFAKLQVFYSPWNTESKSYQYTASVAIPNCVKALALLSFCLGVRNQRGLNYYRCWFNCNILYYHTPLPATATTWVVMQGLESINRGQHSVPCILWLSWGMHLGGVSSTALLLWSVARVGCWSLFRVLVPLTVRRFASLIVLWFVVLLRIVRCSLCHRVHHFGIARLFGM